jgi:hypothetical protein
MAGTGQLGAGGFEPRPNAAERRALFDLRREISKLPRGVLAYAEITTPDSATSGSTEQTVTGLSDAFTAISGRRYRIFAQYEVTRSTAATQYIVRIRDQDDNILTEQVSEGSTVTPTTQDLTYMTNEIVSGAKVWRLTVQRSAGAGTVTIGADPDYPSFLEVEDVGML